MSEKDDGGPSKGLSVRQNVKMMAEVAGSRDERAAVFVGGTDVEGEIKVFLDVISGPDGDEAIRTRAVEVKAQDLLHAIKRVSGIDYDEF